MVTTVFNERMLQISLLIYKSLYRSFLIYKSKNSGGAFDHTGNFTDDRRTSRSFDEHVGSDTSGQESN